LTRAASCAFAGSGDAGGQVNAPFTGAALDDAAAVAGAGTVGFADEAALDVAGGCVGAGALTVGTGCAGVSPHAAKAKSINIINPNKIKRRFTHPP
jgi:hypothetical protein